MDAHALAARRGGTTDPLVSRLRIAYLHGRPGPHPAHARLAEALGSEFAFVDFRMRWQDKQRPRAYMITSWLVCAATFPRRNAYDVFLVDNLHFPPVFMKRLFLRRDQKIVAHLGSHTLYFLLAHRFSSWVERLHKWALRSYDALLCEGNMSALIARQLLADGGPPIYETFLGVPDARANSLVRLRPDLENRRIVFIGNGPGDFRLYYKGLDLMIEAVSIACEKDSAISFDIFGEWDSDVVTGLMRQVPAYVRGRIVFRGPSRDVAGCLLGASLYLHCSRGDAFPQAAIEAMTAGVVPLVSEWTGTRQLAHRVSPDLVAPLDAATIAERIAWYFALTPEERSRLSLLSRRVAAEYTESAAVAHYRVVFGQMCEDLGLLPR